MSELKDIDFKVLLELIKNSKLSDRLLAKKTGVSQPTVTRSRARLEREVIETYTVVPKWEKLGYEILAITLVKSKAKLATKARYGEVREKGFEWLFKQRCIIMAGGCQGSGINSFMISLHKSFPDYDEFMYRYKLEWGDNIDDVQTVFVSLVGRGLLKPLNFKYLAEAESPDTACAECPRPGKTKLSSKKGGQTV
ncbi:MAG: Lrp/AsnC family transcriptional regulator [Candidatus Bathyarchaeota archaeon]|jgi:DNA-binding Lrp family transcriptional regulator|nr:Lrp/AsnC family transcriptional regulator [Candidatus Bathyarchaeota archaeon]